MKAGWRREKCGRNEKRTGLLLCALLTLAVFLGSGVCTWRILRPSGNTMVEIVQDNQVLCTIDLAAAPDQILRVGSDGEIIRGDGAVLPTSYNELCIENGTIRVSGADCPDQTCVKMGVLRSEELPVVCLPHRLVIRFAK